MTDETKPPDSRLTQKYFEMFDSGSFPQQHGGLYSDTGIDPHMHQALMASAFQRVAMGEHTSRDTSILIEEDPGKKRLYNKLRDEQLAQIEKAVEAHEYRVIITNITPEADAQLRRYGYTRTQYSSAKGRESTYEFVVDQTQEERARERYLKTVPDWVYGCGFCGAVVCCLCCCCVK